MTLSSITFIALSLVAVGSAFQPVVVNQRTRSALEAHDRRSFLANAALISSGLLLDTQASLAEEEQSEEVYFGCGCFWHVQHEMVQAEKNILGRSDDELTARAGYGGGKGGARDGKVCYHNAKNIAYYGELGHGEVVSVKVPPSKFKEFAVEYCKLFKDGLRPDQGGDRGLEYRNLVALKGGSKSPLAQELVDASKATGDQLDFAVGKGSDADLAKVVWIMDIEKFPFYVGEQYHQFHDGFAFGEDYPNSYNGLKKVYADKGENFGSCPNGMMGVGVGGL